MTAVAIPAGVTTAGALGDRATVPGIPVIADLAPLFATGHLTPGSSLAITGTTGQTSLLLQLLAGATGAGNWCAAIGFPSLGIASAVEQGVALDRLALIPSPGDQWSAVTSALLGAVDLVVFCPTVRCDRGQARRILAQARQHQSVLIIVESPVSQQSGQHQQSGQLWPESPDLTLSATAIRWSGLSVGHGSLSSCQLLVNAHSRRAGHIRRASCRIERATVRTSVVNSGLA